MSLFPPRPSAGLRRDIAFCLACALEAHVHAILRSGTIVQTTIGPNVRDIGAIFTPGEQEDANEFLL